MTFGEILDQAIAMLQRRGRVTYRLLQRQFQLDDDTLRDLRAELRYAHGAVISEDEQGMVWTGGAAVLPTPPPAVSQPFQPSVSQEAPAPQADGTPTTPSTPDAERRQLTVMFCDLVDSTKLSSQLDPEDYRDVVRAYQKVCSEVITRFDGHIAQLLGDGLLVYFGYPQAHEDDAQRAVRTGLGILDALEELNKGLQRTRGIQLAIRVGVHTGLVIVGEMGGAGRQEQLALGEVPNIASRIEGLATPNTIAVSEATYRLVEGYFTCESLGEHTLRGVSQPLNIYRVLGASGVQNRLDIVSTRGLTPLVSREQEVGLLLERWAQVKDGQGHVVLLTGDAGIGKSRLVQILKDHVAQEPHIRWECRSLPYYQNTTLYPLTDLFQRLLRFQTDHSPEEKLAKLAQELSQYRLPVEETVPLLAPLLSLALPEHHYPPLNLSPQRQRQKTLETIIAILLELAEHQPVLFILEDLHWTDPSTLELLNLVIEQTPTASLLTLLTCRPHFQPAWHHRSYLTEITVNRLSPTQVKQIVTGMTDGKTFPAEVLAQIVEKTDGVPLFIEELTKAILESGQLRAVDGNYELTGSFATFAIPATLQDSLMARLDRLMTGKVIAQLGATIGRRFSYALLQAVAQLNDRTLQEELHRLVEAELLYQRGVPPQATYTFKHALIQEAAYESLLKSTRQLYHQHTAQVLVEQFPDLVETQPELLAQHYTEAGRAEEAVEYWQRAGERSSVRSAYVEAVAHCTKGLEVLKTLPDTPARAQRELNLLLPLAGALQASKSFAALEAGDAYARARELCRHVEDTPQLYETLLGLQGFYLNRGEFQVARELGEQALSLAQRLHDPVRLIGAHANLGSTLYWMGELVPARAHQEQALTLPGSQPDHALPFSGQARIFALAYAAFTLWRLGYPAQALARGHEMLSLAQGLSHAFSLVRALHYAAYLHQLRREVRATQERAEAALALLTEQEFGQWMPIVTFEHGWALAAQGQHEAGMAQMHQGLAARQAAGSVGALSEYLTYLAEAYGGSGQAEEGLRLLAEALTWVDTAGQRYYAAEVYRVKGELLLQQAVPDAPQAEACFQQALAIARRQQDRSWELRAAMSLCRLWQRQGKRTEAYELLAPIYGWFTEGFDTADLQDAKTLLEALT